MLRVEDVRDEIARLYKIRKFVSGTVELVGESFLASEPTIFGQVNETYVQRELEWYLSGSLNVKDIPGTTPKIWQEVADSDGFINSNYGHLLLSEANGFQFDNVLKQLIADPLTRRGTAVYTRPNIHEDWNLKGRRDFICTNAVQYLIRDDKLNLVVQMRSNDVVFGYRNDYAWHRWTQDQMISDLAANNIEVGAGPIIWHAASLHLYERHYPLIEHYLETGEHSGPVA